VRTILLIGHGSEDLRSFEETLSKYDYDVIRSIKDLSETCGISDDPEIKLVIADCRKMGEKVLGFYSALRQRKPAIPVILLTSNGFRVDSPTGKILGANTYIVKQVKAGNLERIVTAVLTGNRTAVG
jgi:DNA-binding response OmpR family regulator